jgi:O-antigen/teichoic acid export membrane protein
VRAVPWLRVHGRQGDIRATVGVALVPVAVVGFTAGAALVLAAGPLANALFDPAHRAAGRHELQALGPFVPIVLCSTVALAALRGFGRMAFFAAQNAAVAVARPLAVAAVALAGYGPGGATLAWAVPVAPAAVVAGAVLRRDLGALRAAPRRWSLRALAAELWAYSGPRALASAFTITITWLDVLLVGRLASTSAAGIYGVASRLYVVGSYALQAVGVAAAPQFSGLIAGRRTPELERLYRVGTCWVMAFSWPFYAIMLVFPETMMRTLFGSAYAGGGHALAILGFAGLIDVGTGNAQALLLMSGHSKIYALNTGVGVLVNISLNLLLIPHLGISGAALAWAVTITVTNVAALVECLVLMRVRPFGPGYAVVAAAALGCFMALPLVARAVAGSGTPVFLGSAAVAAVAYLALLRRYRVVLDLHTLWRSLRDRSAAAPDAA